MKTALIVIIVLAAAGGAYSQNDSLAARKDTTITQPAVRGEHLPTVRHDVPFSGENLERLEANEVPPALRKTLQTPEFSGWESGAIHRNIQTNEYRLELVNSEEKKIYYFDKLGNRIENR